MPPRAATILESIAEIFAEIPDVFSTPQWGGRVYKIPGPNGNRKKPKMIAHVVLTKDKDAVEVGFKLSVPAAAAACEKYAWIEPSTFGSFGKNGWVGATLTQKRQVRSLKPLLIASRDLHPKQPVIDDAPPKKRSQGGTAARRVDQVMDEAAAEGWAPSNDW